MRHRWAHVSVMCLIPWKNIAVPVGTVLYGNTADTESAVKCTRIRKCRTTASPGHGLRLMPGMTFCIEPMINGKGDAVRVLGDGWTVVTRSGSLAAHFEHEIAVTQDGPVILTRP